MKNKFEINGNSHYIGFEMEGFHCIGPFLFLLYIYDLIFEARSEKVNILLYADDTMLYYITFKFKCRT